MGSGTDPGGSNGFISLKRTALFCCCCCCCCCELEDEDEDEDEGGSPVVVVVMITDGISDSGRSGWSPSPEEGKDMFPYEDEGPWPYVGRRMSGGNASSCPFPDLDDEESLPPYGLELEGLSHGGFWRFPPITLRGVVDVNELAESKKKKKE